MFKSTDNEALATVRNYRREDVTISASDSGKVRIAGRLETQSHAELTSFLWEFLTDDGRARLDLRARL